MISTIVYKPFLPRLSGKSDVYADDFENRLQIISSHKLILDKQMYENIVLCCFALCHIY
ncbi:hypothetical protein T4C_8593 [Trichinella pseudospiralis]|uniref:Uncharacterized protein n=1 Tax=Trichinella pseudospiralis TaxID=6337 RepID=A0A0V1GN35_TRIPS|nr:hypothetical protein T4C_8593 [Trichinella pseudospiralis]